MTSFEPSDLQKRIMRKLWSMKDNFGPNVIQLATRLRFKTRVDRETVLSLPIEVDCVSQGDLDIDSQVVEELFGCNFIDHIKGQGEMFICIGGAGMLWCQQDDEANANAST